MEKAGIEQQLYTRERGGIFLNSDGYDTIAVSPGLEKSFIKKYLHPICVYNTPNALKKSGEKDEKFYPTALTIIQPETGHLIVGQATFVQKDFTNQRSTFFMHNYIIPTEQKESWIKEPAQIFQINDFKQEYDIQLGATLNTVEEVPYQTENILVQTPLFLETLRINEMIFKKLLLACFSTIYSNKKVFISLDLPLENHHVASKRLLQLLFTYMPYHARKRFGAVTFSNEPEIKKYIHIMFVERDSLSIRDTSLEKQFVFDLPNNRIAGVAGEVEESEYIQYIWEALIQGKQLEDFFSFCEQKLTMISEEKRNHLSLYNYLTLIYKYQLEEKRFYQNNNYLILKSIYFLLEELQKAEEEWILLFLKILKEEQLIKDASILLKHVDLIIAFQKKYPHEQIAVFLLRTIQHFKDTEISLQLWELLDKERVIFKQVIAVINRDGTRDGFLAKYLQDHFQKIKDLDDVLHQLIKLLSMSSSILYEADFIQVVEQKLEEELVRSKAPFQMIGELQNFFSNIVIAEQDKAKFSEFEQRIMQQVKKVLLRNVKMNEITLDDIYVFYQLFMDERELPTVRDAGNEEDNYLILQGLYYLFYEQENVFTQFHKGLSDVLYEKVKAVSRRIFMFDGNLHLFEKMALLFHKRSGTIHHQELFSFLASHANEDLMIKYIVWSFEKFSNNEEYNSALKNYLIKHPKSIWKRKSAQTELKQIKSLDFKKCLKEVEYRTSNSITKWLKQNGMILTIVAAIICSYFIFQ